MQTENDPMRGFLKQYCALPRFTNPEVTLTNFATHPIVTEPDNAKHFLGNLMPTNDTTTKGCQVLQLFLKKRGFQKTRVLQTRDKRDNGMRRDRRKAMECARQWHEERKTRQTQDALCAVLSIIFAPIFIARQMSSVL